jgi:LSD1 subclass zinc finger protein
MKCPTCRKHIGPRPILLEGAKKVTCANCGAVAGVRGLFAFAMVPALLFIVFPFWLLPDDPGLIMLIVGGAGALLYWISFVVFIKLEREGRIA